MPWASNVSRSALTSAPPDADAPTETDAPSLEVHATAPWSIATSRPPESRAVSVRWADAPRGQSHSPSCAAHADAAPCGAGSRDSEIEATDGSGDPPPSEPQPVNAAASAAVIVISNVVLIVFLLRT